MTPNYPPTFRDALAGLDGKVTSVFVKGFSESPLAILIGAPVLNASGWEKTLLDLRFDGSTVCWTVDQGTIRELVANKVVDLVIVTDSVDGQTFLAKLAELAALAVPKTKIVFRKSGELSMEEIANLIMHDYLQC